MFRAMKTLFWVAQGTKQAKNTSPRYYRGQWCEKQPFNFFGPDDPKPPPDGPQCHLLGIGF